MKKIHNEVKHLPRVPDSRKSERGFSLIELLIAMAVVLILVGGLAIAGERSLQGARETTAVQTVQSFTSNAGIFEKNNGGFPVNVAYMQIVAGAAPTCQQDGELTNALANTYGSATGTAIGGYQFLYVAGTTGNFVGSANGCAAGSNTVAPTYDFTANPVGTTPTTKSFCGDETGVYYLPAGTAMTTTGAGCLADNSAALPIGE